MIVRINGTFSGWVGKCCVIDCPSGVSYAVRMVDSDLELGTNVVVWTYEFVSQEGKRSLYGFKDLFNREIFAELILVQGVGPVSATQLVATHGVNLLELVVHEQARALQVKGIGPKTTQNILKGFRRRAEELLEQRKRL